MDELVILMVGVGFHAVGPLGGGVTGPVGGEAAGGQSGALWSQILAVGHGDEPIKGQGADLAE